MKRNLVGKILGKIKIFVQDFVTIRTALSGERLVSGYTKFDFTVDDGKGRLNPSRDKIKASTAEGR